MRRREFVNSIWAIGVAIPLFGLLSRRGGSPPVRSGDGAVAAPAPPRGATPVRGGGSLAGVGAGRMDRVIQFRPSARPGADGRAWRGRMSVVRGAPVAILREVKSPAGSPGGCHLWIETETGDMVSAHFRLLPRAKEIVLPLTRRDVHGARLRMMLHRPDSGLWCYPLDGEDAPA